MNFNILVFPCGSEIGLEIHRSLKFSRHITLFGANSVEDHGKFIYENYLPHLPFYTDENFIPHLKDIVQRYKIDAIYPAMDAVIAFLKENETQIGCKIIAPPQETTQICLSKSKTYKVLEDVIKIPKTYASIDNVKEYPIFLKPDIGYGSRGAKKANDKTEAINHLENYPNCIISEFLSGKEYTADCFTDRHGKLIFCGARERKRVVNGISVNTSITDERQEEIFDIAKKINAKIQFSGAWFVQLKENAQGDLVLLEIAARLGGSSSLNRNKGINFALLSVFNAFDIDTELFINHYDIELDRALDNKYKISIDYDKVYCDFDDCLLFGERINTQLISFIYQCINEGKKVILITKHDRDIHNTLKNKRLSGLFDEIIHLKSQEKKFHFMDKEKSIFIDDSFSERKEVYENLGIPVFAPDMVECLLKENHNLLIIGAKGFAKEILETINNSNKLSKQGGVIDEIYFYDDITQNMPNMLYGRFRILKSEREAEEYFKNIDKKFTIGIGNPKLRQMMYEKFTRLGGKYTSTISNLAEIGSFGVEIGDGCNILGGVKISNDVKIGKGTMIYYNSIITHDVEVGDFVEISPNATLLGRCKVGSWTHIGAGSIIFPDVEIGENCIIAAGAVVRENVPNNTMVAGIPAKIKKQL